MLAKASCQSTSELTDTPRSRASFAPTGVGGAYWLIVPTLRVGMQPGTLRVPFQSWNAERPLRRSHAEHGNDRDQCRSEACSRKRRVSRYLN
ncbi:hypothetical protein FQ192_27560 [Pseudomonas sp. ANT_J12]|nr:hypothetical protein FQ192_27560 [Pseudomonas sp. ANT_J12]